MPRKGQAPKKKLNPDPKYHDRLVAKFINCVMSRGKKSLAEKVFYQAMDRIAERTNEDPIKVFKKAVAEASSTGAKVTYVDIVKKRWADTLGEAFEARDHAGTWETSLMMAAAPDMVRDSARRNLPPVDGLQPALKKGAGTFLEAGGEDAYFGDPTAASAEDGENHFEALAEVLSLSVMEYLGSKA